MQKSTLTIVASADQQDTQLSSETADDSPGHPSARRAQSFLFLLLDCDRPWEGGRRHSLAGTDEVTLGRGSDSRHVREIASSTRRLAVTLPMSTLSTRHARLLRVADNWAIQDRGSRNGTWVNYRRMDYAELSDGDILQMGRAFFMYRRYDRLEAGSTLADVLESPANEPHPSLVSLSPEVSHENELLRSAALVGRRIAASCVDTSSALKSRYPALRSDTRLSPTRSISRGPADQCSGAGRQVSYAKQTGASAD